MTLREDSPDAVRSRGAALALGEIECLADEMASLMRMGIPLAAGLRELAPSLGGRLSAFTAKLAGSIESGKDLSAALHEERGRLPVFFRAVVDAGIRSGDPAIALKSIAETARRMDECRRVEFHAFIYPFLVGGIAIGLACLVMFRILPVNVQLYVAESTPLPWPLVWASEIAAVLRTYWWALLLALLCIWLMLWLRPTSWRAMPTSSSWLGVGRIPWRRNIIACARWSIMLEVLALLLKRQVPLDESLTLAADVALPQTHRDKVKRLAERCRAGQRPGELDYIAAGFPRAIASGLATPRRAEALIQVLKQLETEYRCQAHDLRRRFNGPWLTCITIGIAAIFVVTYLVIAILPVVQVYFDVVNNRIN